VVVRPDGCVMFACTVSIWMLSVALVVCLSHHVSSSPSVCVSLAVCVYLSLNVYVSISVSLFFPLCV